MPDIIQLLPDSVANQIAAGEVIQRPASVIKELIENAVDAGATSIAVIVKDAGRTLIQVIDNGKGMSETDARMSFERHATSKIRKADDLFAIRSMGFRGEALASVAAIAEVVLQTRTENEQLGTEITARATEVISQEPVACNRGANFAIKNLFFNVPARRKFLKSDAYEFRLMVAEIHKVAIAFPAIEFKMQHNATEVFNWSGGSLKQRITQIFGKNINNGLITLNTPTTIVKVTGFIGTPEIAKKGQSEQFFFVNNRYMKHPYFHKAILLAYSNIMLSDLIPSYFVFLEVDPANIDVNIHPTKTEIKFEEEQAIWQIINACSKEALGKFNIVPSIDFNGEQAIDIPLLSSATQIKMPVINVNPNFNPFDADTEPKFGKKPVADDYFKRNNMQHWESLYVGFEKDQTPDAEPVQTSLFADKTPIQAVTTSFMQLKNKYILSPAKSGLMLIDQKRAHERILFEQFMAGFEAAERVSQHVLFPQVITLSPNDHGILLEYIDLINKTGFDIRDFGNNTVVVNGCPAEIENPNPQELLMHLLDDIRNSPQQAGHQIHEYIAGMLSKASAIPYGKVLGIDEMRNLVDRLFACTNHNYTPHGKTIVSIVSLDEIEKRLR